jgi:HEAT repeat protein
MKRIFFLGLICGVCVNPLTAADPSVEVRTKALRNLIRADSLELPLLQPVPRDAETQPAQPKDQGEETSDEKIVRSAGLKTENSALLEYLKKRTRTDPDQTLRTARTLVVNLGDDDFDVREKASKELIELGSFAIPELRRGLRSDDPEIRNRAKGCLAVIAKTERSDVTGATIRLLTNRKPNGVVEALLDFVPFAGEPGLIEEVLTSLEELAVTEGKPAAGLVRALENVSARKRAVAAEVLGRAGARSEQATLNKLLQDSDSSVQLGAAIGLFWLADPNAIEPLIRLLETLPEAEVWRAEDLLMKLAQDRGPPSAAGKSDEQRRAWVKSWQKWWTTNRNQVDLAACVDLNRQPILFRETFNREDTNITDRYKQMRFETNGKGRGSVARDRLVLTSEEGGDKFLSLSISSRVLLGQRVFPKKFQVQARLGGEETAAGLWHVGVSLGDVRVLFHPGLSGGAFRVESTRTREWLAGNDTMPFTPKANVLHDLTIDVDTVGDVVTLKVLLEEGGNTGKQFRRTIEMKTDVIGPMQRISLDRSGQPGGAGLFGSLVIKR